MANASKKSPRSAARPKAPKRRRRGVRRRRAAWLAIGLAALGLALLSCLWVWALLPGPGSGKAVHVRIPASIDARGLGELLANHELIRSPTLFRFYLRLVRPSVDVIPGGHLLNDAQSPRGLVQRLARLANRPSAKVTVPEGFQHVQIGARLEQLEICQASAFAGAVHSKALLRELDIRGPSAEGLLFPATYELPTDSDPAAVVRAMVKVFRKRFARVAAGQPGALEGYRSKRGWGEHELTTLASIVEREATHADERPRIAGVYLNRLDDPEFRPLRRLQADPTAAYGCVLLGASLSSCAGYTGKVTPQMLRDAANPYNTYAHSGLPPGPIANPGEGALRAVLAPEKSEFLFFVARGDGRHTFSRTLEDHQRATTQRPD